MKACTSLYVNDYWGRGKKLNPYIWELKRIPVLYKMIYFLWEFQK